MIEELLSLLPPELIEALKNCEQDKRWHGEGSVYNHTVLVMQELEKLNASKDLLIAAIFHDTGKLETTSRAFEDGIEKIHHYNHEVHSKNFIDKFLHLYYNYIMDEKCIREVVKEHMRAHKYVSEEMSNKNKRKSFENLPYFNDIITFTTCDALGSRRE